MASRSQAITWKLMGYPPDKRFCYACSGAVTLKDDLAFDELRHRVYHNTNECRPRGRE